MKKKEKEKDMETEEIISKLEAKGIKPTSNRILVMKALASGENPQSLKDLEQKMVSMDKSSIFRTLTLFLEHDAVHAFEDGRGVLNYELCEEDGECDHHDGHIHFIANRAIVRFAWRIFISRVSSCQRVSIPTPSRSSSRENALSVGRSIAESNAYSKEKASLKAMLVTTRKSSEEK